MGEISFLDNEHSALFRPHLDLPLAVLHWHGDRILLPTKAELIAVGSRCREQFFRLRNNSYGIQFHIEIDDKMVYRWISEDVKFIQSALGNSAEVILLDQQRKFGKSTLQRRLVFLNRLFDLVFP